MDSPAVRAERYRSKAEEVRASAESMTNWTCRRMLMTVAQDYLVMAVMCDREVAKGERRV
ncbi:MAG TPA: hypothetical protein VGL35_10475 [Rhizomicrobium sp.]|jgi:hypothetical protein